MSRVLLVIYGRIYTEVFGTENLPASGGYVMYSNHQGRSFIPFAKEVTDLLDGCRLDKSDIRKQMTTAQIASLVRSKIQAVLNQ